MNLKNPYIYNVLDICTCYMTEEDVTNIFKGPAYELSEYGWLIYVGETEYDWYFMSKQFQEIINYARKNDCMYVRFDRDGAMYDDLEVYDW